MMLAPEGPSALPLWINGHAFLTMPEDFQSVVNPTSGEALRLVPLCGQTEVQQAVDASVAITEAWAHTPMAARRALLSELQTLLKHYAAHFAKLLAEETGADSETAAAWVAEALQSLGQTATDPVTPTGPTALLMDASQTFTQPVAAMATALAQGQCVLIKTSPKAPSALFALAELTARAGFPGGVVNVIHGDLAAIDAIAQEPRIGNIQFMGTVELRQQVAARLAKFGKSLQT